MLGRVKRIIKSSAARLLPPTLHSSIRLRFYLGWPDRDPRQVDQFDADPVLVLAPHPDDEVIGPGGTVRRHVLAGAIVTPVVLTDGRFGGYDPEGTIVARRKKESQDAAAMLGTEQPIFFDQPDGALTDSPDLVSRVAELLIRKKARYIYLPAPTDNHRDHWACNRILHAALPSLPREQREKVLIRGYEIWSPTMASISIDITSQVEIKRQAIAAFPSQTSIDDYACGILGLNQYRALKAQHGKGYCEAFMEMTAAEFARIHAAANLRM